MGQHKTLTEKICCCCMKVYVNGEPGMKGVLRRQDIPAGICMECREKYGEKRIKRKIPEYVYEAVQARMAAGFSLFGTE